MADFRPWLTRTRTGRRWSSRRSASGASAQEAGRRAGRRPPRRSRPRSAGARAAPEPEPAEPVPSPSPSRSTAAGRRARPPSRRRARRPSPSRSARPRPAAEPTRAPLFADEVADAAPADHGRRADAGAADRAGEPEARRRSRASRCRPALGRWPPPSSPASWSALLTVGLTWASLRGCEALQGTSSCGGPGLLLLLRDPGRDGRRSAPCCCAPGGVADPGSTSFLGGRPARRGRAAVPGRPARSTGG